MLQSGRVEPLPTAPRAHSHPTRCAARSRQPVCESNDELVTSLRAAQPATSAIDKAAKCSEQDVMLRRRGRLTEISRELIYSRNNS